ncbi:39S ribosomal protein L22, mitochondrial [Cimex lectularius]|uniref:Large ribosomal subunit protein uL22m n=1 Tax=Cimex lectularius TaxID=79782 RepID=A0A8I6S8I1_CIMLE|nr:39S ribosomal protein L22, mitochondrial [Cimex lectularius]
MFFPALRLGGANILPSLHKSILNKAPLGCLSVLSRNVTHKTTQAMPELPEHEKEPEKPKKWLSYNNLIFPPQKPDEEPRPAYVCHAKYNIKYSPKKMWYVACFVRGMSVDEAVRQLSFVNKKGAVYVKEAILEAQELAVEKHNVEFKSNLWVAESFTGKGYVIKGYRKHARGKIGMVKYKYCHYFVRLEEGKPPVNYYNKPSMDKESLLSKWLDEMRARRPVSSL